MWNSEQAELFKASITPGSWQGLEQKAKAFLPSFCEAQSLRSFKAHTQLTMVAERGPWAWG